MASSHDAVTRSFLTTGNTIENQHIREGWERQTMAMFDRPPEPDADAFIATVERAMMAEEDHRDRTGDHSWETTQMETEDLASAQAMEVQWYQDQDEHMEIPNDASSTWDRYWDHYPRPFSNTPWRGGANVPDATSTAASPLGTTTAPKASAMTSGASAIPARSTAANPKAKSQPDSTHATGWRAKLVWLVAKYQLGDWDGIQQLMDAMRSEIQGGTKGHQSWKYKAQKWFQYWDQGWWQDLEQLQEWYLSSTLFKTI